MRNLEITIMLKENGSLDWSGFFLYKGKPVAVDRGEKLPFDIVCETEKEIQIRFIQRTIKEPKIVLKKDLIPLTEDLANKLISEYNVRNHALYECLEYM